VQSLYLHSPQRPALITKFAVLIWKNICYTVYWCTVHCKCTVSWAWIFKQSLEARNRVGIELSYRPARLHSLAELVPWNRFLGSWKVYKFGLSPLTPNARYSNTSSATTLLKSRDWDPQKTTWFNLDFDPGSMVFLINSVCWSYSSYAL
jgi:hypothetical protein